MPKDFTLRSFAIGARRERVRVQYVSVPFHVSDGAGGFISYYINDGAGGFQPYHIRYAIDPMFVDGGDPFSVYLDFFDGGDPEGLA